MGQSASAHNQILLVEDDSAIREAFAQLLEDEGYTVTMATNGEEALSYLRSDPRRPCVIMLDLMMPVMDGYEFRAEQLRDPQLTTIPVVVVSADRRARAAAGPLQFQHVLTKPVDIDLLLQTIAALCGT